MSKVSILVMALTIGFVCGCMAEPKSLVDAGQVRLEKQNAGKVYVVWSDAYRQDKGFKVTGVIKRRDRVGTPIKIRVNVSILGPDGALVAERHSPDIYVPRRIIGRGQSSKRFAIHFAVTPPPGSLIRVEVPAGSSTDAI
jgi:hypothetical protein